MSKPIADTFYILDFDRCIGNTDKLFDAFERTVVDHTGLTAWSLRNVRHEVEAVGDSFDTATYVRAQLHLANEEQKWRALERDFVSSSEKETMLTPGAQELLDWLNSNNLPYGILTYGEKIWQKLKIQAAGLKEVPQLITTNKHKGSVIQEWQRTDGVFKLPDELGGGLYRSLVLIDDKAVSFDNFPPLPSTGYWVLPRGHVLPSQAGEVPGNVTRLASLKSVREHLSDSLNLTSSN